jgi:hypothetical protein
MKKFLASCAAIVVLLSHSNSFAGDQDFTLLNSTGVEIHALYVSPADKNEWGSDILGKDTLASGQTAEISFDPTEEAAKWDLKVSDEKGNSIEWSDLDLTEISKVTLNYKGGKATADVE